ncbi:MAG TPA: helix-turn-helix domain-containing protein [Solirubrobacteraceae bacterium]
MATTAPRWQRLEHDERREQILACARRLFSERPAQAVSMTEVARAAGVTRGLLNHYFGTKRALELEVVRQMVHVPEPPAPEEIAGRELRDVLAEYTDRWLTMVKRNHETWFASRGAGDDPELRAILDEAREQAAARVVAPILAHDAGADPRVLQPLIRAFSGLAEDATHEWLLRKRLTRKQTHVFLTESLLSLINDVAPKVATA